MQTHSTRVELSEPLQPELAVGSDFVVKVRVWCPAGCDVSRIPIAVDGPDGLAVTIAPRSDHDPAEAGVAPGDDNLRDLALKAPAQVGEHVWTVRFPPHESDGVRHAECALPVCVRTTPHATSLAVWAVPSPVVMGERFRIKVGAKSAAGCELRTKKIAVYDQAGAVIAQASLQDAPWPGTSALYWTEVEVPAPSREGMSWFTVNFAAADIATPHEPSSSKFSVAIVRPPEHRLTVEVLEQDSKAPIEDAQVRLGAYRAVTDPSGRAEVAMPKGSYDLTVWKVGYEAPGKTVDVHEDASVRVEAAIVPPENPDAAWLM
jgi:uncharacterized membrane protein